MLNAIKCDRMNDISIIRVNYAHFDTLIAASHRAIPAFVARHQFDILQRRRLIFEQCLLSGVERTLIEFDVLMFVELQWDE